MKLYTKTGDGGSTGLYGADRVSKAHPRVEAYGTVDELNSALGLARAHASGDATLDADLEYLQNALFDVGPVPYTPPTLPTHLPEFMSFPGLPPFHINLQHSTLLPPVTYLFYDILSLLPLTLASLSL